MKSILTIIILSTTCILFAGSCFAVEKSDLMTDIEKIAQLGEKAPRDLTKSVVERIDGVAADITPTLLKRLQDKDIKEDQIAVYVWALGLARQESAVAPIIKLAKNSASEIVRISSSRALASIGGETSADFLMAQLADAKDEDARYGLINMLAQMQNEKVLPETVEILERDPQRYYWQAIFVFGKMGDKAVPFLINKLSDKNPNVRKHSMHILGPWLMAPEAAQVLRKRFWKEKDVEERQMILSTIMSCTLDLAEIQTFLNEVAEKEKDETLSQNAKEALEGFDQMLDIVAEHKLRKDPSAENFQAEYDKLFGSAGKEGNYSTLSSASTFKDESKLKALRERILQRDSDEAFYDHGKVNKIIMLNRYLNALQLKKKK